MVHENIAGCKQLIFLFSINNKHRILNYKYRRKPSKFIIQYSVFDIVAGKMNLFAVRQKLLHPRLNFICSIQVHLHCGGNLAGKGFKVGIFAIGRFTLH